MKVLFTVLVVYFIGFIATEEIGDPRIGTLIRDVIDDIIAEGRSQIPEEIYIPNTYFNGLNDIVLYYLSTRLEAVDTKITGVKHFYCEIGYKGIIPSTYTFKFNIHSAFDYLFRVAFRGLPFIGINSGSPVKLDVNNMKFYGDLIYTVVPPRILLDTAHFQIDGVVVNIDSIFGSPYLGSLISEYLSTQFTASVIKHSHGVAYHLKNQINFYLKQIFPGNTQKFVSIDYTDDDIVANAQALEKGLEKFIGKIQALAHKLYE